MRTASAEDVLVALTDGLDSDVEEKGRSFSGGQRQRLILVRALLADPSVLVLVEPTSAVDAHTEARIAERLREHRAGRSTVVLTSSPLLLDRVDEVIFVAAGRVVAVGKHRELLETDPQYRRTVTRQTEERGGARMRQILPVADSAEVRRHARRLARRHPRELLITMGLHALAAVSGLAAPRLIGRLVEDVQQGTTAGKVNQVILVIAVFIVAQSLLTRWARFRSFALGEQVLAELREEFVDNALALPIGTVERAGTGDLLSRTSRDVDALSRTVRFAVPETIVAFVTVLFTVGGDAARRRLGAGPAARDGAGAVRSAPGGTCAARRTATCGRTRRTRR